MKKTLTILTLILITFCSQAQTIGLTVHEADNLDGYVLFSGIASNESYLIDKCGEKVKKWMSAYKPGLSVDLLTTGELFRTGALSSPYFGSGSGKGGILEKFDWDGNLTWSYQISSATECQHHDAIVLPNGNILAIVWDLIDLAEATQAGKNPSITNNLNGQAVWSEKIIEIQPVGSTGGNIVWEWRAFDHLVQDFDITKDNFGVVSEHPELLNVNYVVQGPPANPDWLHINSVDYNPITDEIIVSPRAFSEFWIIDHSTTTAEAEGSTGGNSGKGGDILYRWGNPRTYDRGTNADQKLFKQHHATFIKADFPDAGKVLLFNNGENRPTGDYSSIDMIDISEAGYPYTIGANTAYLPETTFWTYADPNPTSFFATNISGVFPLSNGSFLFTDGPKGEMIEIDNQSNIVWSYINPTNNQGPMSQGDIPNINTVFRASFYPPEFSAFTGRNLVAEGPIELNPANPYLCATFTSVSEIQESFVKIFPNPIKQGGLLTINNDFIQNFTICIYDLSGKFLFSKSYAGSSDKVNLLMENIEKGIYFVELTSNNQTVSKKIIID